MILIADSGSTKTAWTLVEKADNVIKTDGINPVFMNSGCVEEILRSQLLPQLGEQAIVTEIYFYGAGCASAEKKQPCKTSLAKRFWGYKNRNCVRFIGCCTRPLQTPKRHCLHHGNRLKLMPL